MTEQKKSFLAKTASVFFALAVWQILAAAVGSDLLFAGPWQVLVRVTSLLLDSAWIATVGYSLLRISGGFLAAFVLGILAAFAASRFRLVEYLLWPFIITVKAVPVASFIILCLIWLSYGQLAVFISFLISFPVIYSNVLQGIKSTNRKHKEVATLYRVPWRRRFLYLYLPSIKPFLLSACSVGIGMAWKSGVAAEVIGVVTGSIGEKLYDAKIYFQNADLLAWTVMIIAVSVLTEKLFLAMLQFFYRRLERL